MDTIYGFSKFFTQVVAGDERRFRNLGVIPLKTPAGYANSYMALDEAIERNLIEITESTKDGQVGNLKVKSSADIPVLLLDGEELVGAKQNRILNTSILIGAGGEVTIPVSCVEQGRWSYRSKKFKPSDTVFFQKGRREKTRDVTHSIQFQGDFAGNQGKVWDSVSEINFFMKAQSDTGAMRAAFDKSKSDLDSFIENLPCGDGQNGMLVFINNKIAGCDVVTNPSVFRRYYPKLLRSYAIDALCETVKGKHEKDEKEQAARFFSAASVVRTHPAKSKGLGYDLRIEEEEMVGSALIVDDEPVHVALFALE